MSVEDWARREATRRLNAVGSDVTPAEASEFGDGIVHAFSALLSDEAVEAGAGCIDDPEVPGEAAELFRSALQAAVDAVTSPEPSDSSTTTTGEQA